MPADGGEATMDLAALRDHSKNVPLGDLAWRRTGNGLQPPRPTRSLTGLPQLPAIRRTPENNHHAEMTAVPARECGPGPSRAWSGSYGGGYVAVASGAGAGPKSEEYLEFAEDLVEAQTCSVSFGWCASRCRVQKA